MLVAHRQFLPDTRNLLDLCWDPVVPFKAQGSWTERVKSPCFLHLNLRVAFAVCLEPCWFLTRERKEPELGRVWERLQLSPGVAFLPWHPGPFRGLTNTNQIEMVSYHSYGIMWSLGKSPG